jgi:hypothetical protein
MYVGRANLAKITSSQPHYILQAVVSKTADIFCSMSPRCSVNREQADDSVNEAFSRSDVSLIIKCQV